LGTDNKGVLVAIGVSHICFLVRYGTCWKYPH
jgi:hypothetical protein